ncbi:MAG: nucleotide exchange factor GrpE [Chloroflexi bacterium]|nr:nucleotide exchange factor GrpE [Chloroflexota bacterium]
MAEASSARRTHNPMTNNQEQDDVPLEGDTAGEAAAPAEEAGVETPGDVERIAALEAEVAQLTEQHARAVADLQNYRRRTEERWRERARAQLAETIARCLPPLDDLSRALASVDGALAEDQWIEGIRLVERKFKEMLAGAGAEEIGGEGAAFDPLVHEAVSSAPGPEGQVIALVREGYRIENYVLRPAQVVVGAGEAGSAEGGRAGE